MISPAICQNKPTASVINNDSISVIIPTYNEEVRIRPTLAHLAVGDADEVIVVDGASSDRTVEYVSGFTVRIMHSMKNRALQMNQGAQAARGNILLFLHADCFLEEESLERIKECIALGYVGGCLRQRIDSSGLIYRIIEHSGNARASLFKIFYGDQAIFVRKDIFFEIGKLDTVALFDDVLFSKKLKRAGKMCVLNKKVYTSARRWQKQGIAKTTFINWLVSLGFLLGLSPQRLKKIYYDIR